MTEKLSRDPGNAEVKAAHFEAENALDMCFPSIFIAQMLKDDDLFKKLIEWKAKIQTISFSATRVKHVKQRNFEDAAVGLKRMRHEMETKSRDANHSPGGVVNRLVMEQKRAELLTAPSGRLQPSTSASSSVPLYTTFTVPFTVAPDLSSEEGLEQTASTELSPSRGGRLQPSTSASSYVPLYTTSTVPFTVAPDLSSGEGLDQQTSTELSPSQLCALARLSEAVLTQGGNAQIRYHGEMSLASNGHGRKRKRDDNSAEDTALIAHASLLNAI